MIDAASGILSNTATGFTDDAEVNYKPVFQETGNAGRRCLWVVAILMLISSLVFYILAGRAPVQRRLFHVLISVVTTVSFLAYFAMAMGGGVTYLHGTVHRHHKNSPDTVKDVFRQLFWVRWLNWGLTFPLILISLTIVSGLNGASMLVAITANVTMLVAGLASVLFEESGNKWAWYTIACLGYLTVVYQIGFRGRQATMSKEARVKTFYASIAGSWLVVLLVYPIIWAASHNSRRMSINAEIIVYAVLDILSQGIFGYWLLVSHDSTDAITLNSEGFWATGIGNEGTIRLGEA